MKACFSRFLRVWAMALLAVFAALPALAAEPLLSTDLDVPGAERIRMAPATPAPTPTPQEEQEPSKDDTKFIKIKKHAPARELKSKESGDEVIQDKRSRSVLHDNEQKVVQDLDILETNPYVIDVETDISSNKASGAGVNAVSNVGTVSVGNKR